MINSSTFHPPLSVHILHATAKQLKENSHAVSSEPIHMDLKVNSGQPSEGTKRKATSQ